MITCSKCKWWGAASGDEPSYRYCTHKKCMQWSGLTDGFDIVDGEWGKGGCFASGPDFGCIHGEEKEVRRGARKPSNKRKKP